MKCTNPALFRYTWPGKDESMCCLEHSIMLAKIADAIGLPSLQMIQVNQRQYIDENKDVAYCQIPEFKEEKS